MTVITATHLVRNDHKKITGLFRQFEVVDLRAQEMKGGVAKEILMELEIHGVIEEEIFYPALAEDADKNIQAIISNSRDTHTAVQRMIDDLWRMKPKDPGFSEKFTELIEMIEPHIQEEEKVLLPLAEVLLGERLVDLGVQMQSRKQHLAALPKYVLARPEVSQNPRGGEQMRRRVAS